MLCESNAVPSEIQLETECDPYSGTNVFNCLCSLIIHAEHVSLDV